VALGSHHDVISFIGPISLPFRIPLNEFTVYLEKPVVFVQDIIHIRHGCCSVAVVLLVALHRLDWFTLVHDIDALPAVDGTALLVGIVAFDCVILVTGVIVAMQSDTLEASHVGPTSVMLVASVARIRFRISFNPWC
jgi:hypothetical protein